MSKSKNYNSIVFLTTLSVYLGLVLVGGATPAVWAHSALTGNFDIKNEIVLEDDLEKNPDEEKSLTNYVFLYQKLFELAQDFTEKKRADLRTGTYEFDCSVTYRANLSQTVYCQGGSGLFWGGFLTPINDLGKGFPHTADEEKNQIKVNLLLSESEFVLKSSFTQESDLKAQQFADFYNVELSNVKIREINTPQIIIYQNTQISRENDQFLIVTRLPRGSIDELLAEKTAQ